jgi:hypothetical protein
VLSKENGQNDKSNTNNYVNQMKINQYWAKFSLKAVPFNPHYLKKIISGVSY